MVSPIDAIGLSRINIIKVFNPRVSYFSVGFFSCDYFDGLCFSNMFMPKSKSLQIFIRLFNTFFMRI